MNKNSQRTSHQRRRRRMYQFAPEQDVSLEIGLIDKRTVHAVFNFFVASSDFTTGVTVKVNGSTRSLSSATLQSDHRNVYYVLSSDADANDVITWEYNAGVGDYYIEQDQNSSAIDSFTARPVTNNISYVIPELDTAEIGSVLSTTLVATYTAPVLASNYKNGIAIFVNGVQAVIATATRQSNHAIVRYVIPAVLSTDVITIEYHASLGNYSNEDDGSIMLDLAITDVTNNAIP